jgi:putative hydrolase of the HAD superfamily
MERTINAFANLSGSSIKELQSFYSSDTYKLFEKGLISANEFREVVNRSLKATIEENDFDAAWNAMLLDIPNQRIELIESLGRHYNVYLISNTNEIHVPAFNSILSETTKYSDLSQLFLKTYYSHEIKMRKPDREIYDFVLSDSNLLPEETVMIDDRLDNLEGAREAGLGILHITESYTIIDHFSE